MTLAELIKAEKAKLAKGIVLEGEADEAKQKDFKEKNAELEDKWFKAFATQDVKTLKGMEKELQEQYVKAGQATDTNSGADGGFLVPITVQNTIIQRQYAESKIRQLATVLSNVVGELRLTAEGDTATAYWVGEGDASTETTQKFARVTLNPQKLTGFVKFTDEVLVKTASNPSIRDFVVSRLVSAANRLEAAAFVSGDGSEKPTGFRQATLPVGNVVEQVGEAYAITDVLKLYRALPEQYRANASWLANDNVLGLVDLFTDSNGRPLMDAFTGDVDTIKRRPVYTEDNIPSNLDTDTDESEVYFGDFSQYIIADGSGMRIDYGTEGSDFKNGKISVRLIKYVDGALALPEAVAKTTSVVSQEDFDARSA